MNARIHGLLGAACVALFAVNNPIPVRAAMVMPVEMIDAGTRAEIEFIQHLDSVPPAGWIPVGFRIVNRSPAPREWRARFECDVNTGTQLLGEWPLTVPGNATREFSLLLPQPWFATMNAYFQIRGRVTGPDVRAGALFLNRTYTGGNQTSFIGMSQRLATENWSRLEAELTPSDGAAVTQLHGSRVTPAQMPADWRAWSGFASVWLHRDDWIELLAPQRLALLRWVAQGGDLYVAGPSEGLDDLPALKPLRTESGADWSGANYVFGTITRLDFEDERSGGATRLPIAVVAHRIKDAASRSPGLAQLTNDIPPTDAEKEFGTIEPGGVMLGSLITVIAILLGPVNIFLLAPARRRARLFITVPVISVGGALALVALILVQDGIGGEGRRGVLIALIPDRPEALVLQEQVARTGLLLGGGFRTDEALTFVDYTDTTNELPAYYGPGYGTLRQARGGLDRSQGEFAGNWFTSRTVQSHHLRGFIPTRAALTVNLAGDKPTVLSTCPATLRDLKIYYAQGRGLRAAEIPPGREVELEWFWPERETDWREDLAHFGTSLAAVNEREFELQTFSAVADRWDESIPFATHRSIDWRNDRIVITGPVRLQRK